VQVTIAEVEPGQGVADELAFAHGPGVDVGQVGQQQREETAALAVHGAPRDGSLRGDLGPVRFVAEVDELIDLGAQAVEVILKEGAAAAMNRFNRKNEAEAAE